MAFAEPGTPTRIANTSLVTTHDVPAPPAGSGNVVQVVAINANPTITPPSGYTPLLDVPNPFNTTKLFVCYRFAVARVATWVGWERSYASLKVEMFSPPCSLPG